MNNDELLTILKNRFSESDVELLSKLLFETAHPIGSYLFTNNSTSPNLYLVGGAESTWQRIGDRFLYAVTNDSDVDQLGGERNVTLNVNQIPAHTHLNPNDHFYVGWGNCASDAKGLIVSTPIWGRAEAYDKNAWLNKPGDGGGGAEYPNQMFADQAKINSNSTGGNQPHNNMPPWYGCVVWKRVS